ncbi:MAG: ku family containing protein [bacterium]|nr:ku family containing protein [bacterium]
MPEKRTIERAKKDKREGKSASTQAGEFVRQEIEHVRQGKHGVKSTKQAIAIGLSEARRAGVKIPGRRGEKPSTGKKASGRVSSKRSRASEKALKRQPRAAASSRALSRQAKSVARKRSPADRSRAAKKAARTRKRQRARG